MGLAAMLAEGTNLQLFVLYQHQFQLDVFTFGF
jgi:hypothetical protein